MTKKNSRKPNKPVKRDSSAEVLAPAEVVVRGEQLAQQIRNDMQVAENGLFHYLRAGLGLLRIRDMYEHGAWGPAIASMFPDKSDETIGRYMRIGTNFCEKHALDPLDAWNGMQNLSADHLLAAPESGLMRAKDKVNPLELDVRTFVNEFGSVRKAMKGETAEELRKKDKRPQTKAERQEAARGIWLKIIGMAQHELDTKSSADLKDDDLDSLSSVLRTIYDELRKQLAKRSIKI